eukprot:jgi/Orpsp1_1/1186921/evm.model.d7180000054122.1
MVNFKYWSLPLLVGLLGRSVRADGESAAVQGCILTENGSSVTATEGCTAGIYKTTTALKYIECRYNNARVLSCSLVNLPTTETSACTAALIGQLIKKGSDYLLCLGEFGKDATQYPSVKLGEDTAANHGKYFVQHTPQTNDPRSVFSFDITAHYYVVELSAKGIAFDNTETLKDHCASIEGKLTTRKEDFCSPTGSGRYYTCTNGICKEVRNQVDYELINKEKEVDPSDAECNFSISGDTCSINSTTKCQGLYGTTLLRFTNGTAIVDSTSTGLIVEIGQKADETQCTVIKADGYYINEDTDTENKSNYPLILCSSGTCTLKEYEEGTFLSTTKGKIITCSEKACSETDPDDTLYINKAKKLSLIKCTTTENSCETMDANSNSYYLKKASEPSGLILCESEVCTNKNDIADGYYLNGEDTKTVISCSNNSCSKIDKPENYYIDASISDKKGLIYCTGEACQKLSGLSRFVYISGVSGAQKLIVCSSDKCVEKSATDGDYYINGGNGKNEKPLIECKEGKCQEYTPAANTLYITLYINSNGNVDKKTNAIIRCTTNNNAISCDEISTDFTKKLISISDASIISYTGSSFRKSEIGKTTAGYYLINKETSEVLTSNLLSGSLVNCRNTAPIDQTAKYECESISSGYSNFYIGNDDKLIQYSGSKLSFVEKIEDGYYINSQTDIIQCYREKCWNYKTTVPDCNSADYLGVMIGNKLCVKIAGKDSQDPLNTTASKYILYLSANVISNGKPTESGFEGNVANFYLISADSTKIIIVRPSSSEYYLADTKSTATVTSPSNKLITSINKDGDLYECKSDGCTKNPIPNDGKEHFYPNDDVNTYSTFANIICQNTTCMGKAAGSDDYYCLYTENITEYQNKLSVCKTGTGCPTKEEEIKANCNVQKHKNGFYFSKADNTYLIDCKEDKCKKNKDIKVGYYVSQDIKKPLIQCVNSLGVVRCTTDVTINNGKYYIKEGSSLIKCDNGVCSDVIKCDNGVCSDVDEFNQGWYVSGESGMVLTYCGSSKCTADSKPLTGWYINNTGKNLIKCTSTNGVISCSENEILNTGYYLNAGESGKLIKCVKGDGCTSEDIKASSYYVNGEDNHLIYCDKDPNPKCNSLKFNRNNKLWYLSTTGTSLIGCNKSKGCVEYETPATKGYYMNGDTNTSYYPLIKWDGTKFVLSDDTLINGWYVNGDESSENAEKIIKCSSANSCEYKSVKTQVCSTSISAEFTMARGSLEWCNTDGNPISLNSDIKSTVIVSYKKNDVVPGVNLPENTKEAYALVEYTSKYVIRTKDIDGYKLDNNKLYYCPKDKNGVCTIVKDIKAGLYLEYINKKVIECDSENCTSVTLNSETCNDSNVIYSESEFKLCKMKDENSDKISMGKMNIDLLYALRRISFPGANGRYFMATVNKYYIKLEKEIDEVPKCDEGVKTVCLIGDNIKEGYSATTNLEGDNTEINMNYIVKKITYDYDTNNGYFIYDNGELSKVYISKDEKTKYECNIGGICIENEKPAPPITSYKLSDDGVLQSVSKDTLNNNSEETSVVETAIKEGAYKYDNERMIDCNKLGQCVLKLMTELKKGFTFGSGGKIKFNSIESDTKHSKFVFSKGNTGGSNRKRSIEESDYGEVLELTHVSYTSEELTRNIFVNSYNIMITGDINEEIKVGYTCKLGKCKEIDTTGAEKYYINTVQSGKAANAVAVCGGDNNGCVFKSANDIKIVPNAASESFEDALISCSGNSCEVVAINAEIGLPECKTLSGDKTQVYEDNDKYYRADTGEALYNDQFCILNGKPINKKGDSITAGVVYMFDVALRKIDITKVKENHVYASLYYCKGDSVICTRTYGYVTNGNNYSKCTSTGCTFIGTSEDSTCTLNGAGTIIPNHASSNMKLCIDYKDENAVPIVGENSYYALNIDVSNIYPEIDFGNRIIVGIKGNVVYTLSEDGYLLLNESTHVIENGRNGKLFECSSINNNCAAIDKPLNGYYYTSFNNKSIKCENNACFIDTSSQISFADENEVLYIYERSFPGDIEVISVVTQYKINALLADDFILLNKDGNKFAESGTINASENLYQCTSSVGTCTKKDVKQGWYVSGDANSKAIKCEDKYCTVETELNKTCTSVGELVNKDNAYSICYTKTQGYKLSEKAGEVITFTVGNNVNQFPLKYDVVSVTTNAVIGLADSKTFKDSTDENKYTALAVCTGTASETEKCKTGTGNNEVQLADGYLCKKESSGVLKLYETRSSKCVEIEDEVVVLYGNKKVSSYNEYVGAQMYYCDNSSSCRLTTGYYKVGNQNLSCDGTVCSKVDNISSTKGEISSTGLITDSAIVQMGSTRYDYISGGNKFPGADGKKSILIETGENYQIIFKGDGYYLIGSSGNVIKDEKDTSTSGNTLYNCDGLVCVKQEGINGYYINAATENKDKTITAIITCNNGSCYIAKEAENNMDLFSNTSNCNATTIGRMIRDTSQKNIKFCVNKNGDSLTSSATAVKYYILNLLQGNRFAGIRLENSGDNHADDKANILIKITNRSITQQKISGHILIGTNKDVAETVNTKGTLYYCENNVIYNGVDATVQCNEVSGLKNGWYFNDYFNDNRYIKCTESGCSVVVATTSTECKYTGSLIYNNDKFKLCKTLAKQVDLSNVVNGNSYETMLSISYNDEFPGVKNNNTNILANIQSYNITMNKYSGYVVVNKDNSNILNSKDSVDETTKLTTNEGDLYSCESDGICKLIDIPENNWYIKNNSTGLANDLIKCTNKLCKINFNSEKGFYVSGNKQMPLIQCIQQGDVNESGSYIDSSLKRVCKERKFTEGWYLNSDIGNKNRNPLIKCNSEFGCVENSQINNGWYINAGSSFGLDKLSNSTIYPIIQCSSTECNEYTATIGKSCTKGGEIIYNQSYKLCKNEKDSVDFGKVTGEVYQIVSVANYNDFPAASTGLILVKITKNEVIQVVNNNEDKYYIKDKSMYICNGENCSLINDNDKNGVTVYEELTNNLYTGSCSNNVCSWNLYNYEGYVFLNNNSVIFTNAGDGVSLSDIGKIYKCKKNDSNTLKCFDVTGKSGYYYNPNDKSAGKIVNTLYKYNNIWSKAGPKDEEVRKCTNYNQNICYISLENEPYHNKLTPETPNYITPGEICVTNSGKYYFATAEINTGIDGNNCIPLPTDNSIGYYYVNSKVYNIDKYGVSVVDGTNYIDTVSSYIIDKMNDESKTDGIWFEDSKLNSNTITCNNGSCIKEKTVVCSYDIQSEKCKTSSGTINAGQICKSEGGKMYLSLEKISSSGGSCVRYENRLIREDIDGAVKSRDNSSKYYIIDNKMIKLNEMSVEILGEGVYTLDEDNNLVTINNAYDLDISEESQYTVYVCNKEGCSIKNSCSFENEYEYIYDEFQRNVIKCDPTTNTIKRIVSEGYYLNNPWKTLIKCYSDTGKCKEINADTGMEGYYRDAGNEEKMIVCVRNLNKFVCETQNMIKCNYNENDNLCKADINLLRNSYCYYSKIDKAIGKVEYLLYIENFIRKGDEGKCISGNENDYYFKYKKSKFLGHEEHDGLIKVSKDEIVNIYESNIGYYIIDTKYGMGITEDKELKKTRMYKCEKNKCIEVIKPVSNNIYINKASYEKLVKYNYNDNEWNVIKSRCDRDIVNTEVCNLSKDITLRKGKVVYTVNEDEIILYDVITGNIEKRTQLSKQESLIKGTFLKYDNELYLYNENKQEFNVQDENGIYFFNEHKSGSTYEFNWTPYKSTVNRTEDENYYSENEIKIVIEGSLPGKEGYILNKADNEGLGIFVQYMNIPEKVEKKEKTDPNAEDVEDEVVMHTVYKAVLNKCSSNRRNICVSLDDGKTIPKGSACVVTDGDYKGLYYASLPITKSSSTTNCIKYDSGVVNICTFEKKTNSCRSTNDQIFKEGEKCIVVGGENPGVYEVLTNKEVSSESEDYNCVIDNSANSVYQYENKKMEFAGTGSFENMVFEIKENYIVPFKHDYTTYNTETEKYDFGYYIYDDNKVPFTSETLKESKQALLCNVELVSNNGIDEAKGYKCSQISNSNQYYINKANNKVIYNSGNKWKIETTRGYYFFNENYVAATSRTGENAGDDEILYSKGISADISSYSGKYLNSAVTDKAIMIEFDNTDGSRRINTNDLKTCKVAKDSTCSSRTEDPLQSGDSCYDKDTKKLYIVSEVESGVEGKDNTIMCYSGSEIVKYALLDGKLYQLDGLSIKEMENGYYILNDKMEAFNSDYPELSYKFIVCTDGSCQEVGEEFDLSQDVIFNEAGSDKDRNSLLRYFSSEKKFMKITQSGNYCLNEDGVFPTTDDSSCSSKKSRYYDSGEQKLLSMECGYNNICFNYAKKNAVEMIYNDKGLSDSLFSYDEEKD